jgi:hypothetical protein
MTFSRNTKFRENDLFFAKLRNSFRFRFAKISRNEIPLKTLVTTARRRTILAVAATTFNAFSTLTGYHHTTTTASGYSIASCYATIVGDTTAAAFATTAARRPSTATCTFSRNSRTSAATLIPTAESRLPSRLGPVSPLQKTLPDKMTLPLLDL